MGKEKEEDGVKLSGGRRQESSGGMGGKGKGSEGKELEGLGGMKGGSEGVL